jgi:hypothetical protein
MTHFPKNGTAKLSKSSKLESFTLQPYAVDGEGLTTKNGLFGEFFAILSAKIIIMYAGTATGPQAPSDLSKLSKSSKLI